MPRPRAEMKAAEQRLAVAAREEVGGGAALAHGETGGQRRWGGWGGGSVGVSCQRRWEGCGGGSGWVRHCSEGGRGPGRQEVVGRAPTKLEEGGGRGAGEEASGAAW